MHNEGGDRVKSVRSMGFRKGKERVSVNNVLGVGERDLSLSPPIGYRVRGQCHTEEDLI